MEELDFKGLLDLFSSQGFERGEQVILGHFGTVMTLLTLIFEEPVNVTVNEQREEGDLIKRTVDLVCRGTVVATAGTRIPKSRNRPDVLADIGAKKLGLGQIVVSHQIPNQRKILEVGRNDLAFWRTYSIEGPELYLEIAEFFRRGPFEEVGWLRRKEGSHG